MHQGWLAGKITTINDLGLVATPMANRSTPLHTVHAHRVSFSTLATQEMNIAKMQRIKGQITFIKTFYL